MAKEVKRNFQPFPTSEEVIHEANNYNHQSSWKKGDHRGDDDIINCDSKSIDSLKEDSNSSNSFSSTSSSSDLMEDASSFSSSSSSSSSNGPLFQLSDLMSQLPIKRGLSKYYEGKSQSFTLLTSVESLEDLAKRENPNYRNSKRIKLCKSYCGSSDGQRFCDLETTPLRKPSSKGCFSSSILGRNK